ncbi:DUF6510 family protein [Auraticoccus monumenti]|uniref:MJ0042 family finger-like domain-containing protein n=1 Tax=Auraticoccus monumenti TaxID=675864 RepID=A0A1G7BZC5_9ACTN|nr:DUF6510 family protein [Auraticoccus monumenti]SDE32411.1 hypothetical protein SAMN04489747_3115 [Auraticoccus monumenti]
MRYFEDDQALDGNALAGRLAEIFSVDMTSARVTCSGCGTVRPLAEGRAYVRGPGVTLRCAECQMVLGRIVRARDSVWLELSGVASVQITGVPS